MRKLLSATLGLLFSSSLFAQTGICPDVNQLKYSNGVLIPPAGWSILLGPSCFDNTPTHWEQTSWGGLRVTPNRIQCSYKVKDYIPNSGCGGWTIVRNQTSSDPWNMPNRPAIWVDQGSHSEYPDNPWDFCNKGTGGSITSCYFPLN